MNKRIHISNTHPLKGQERRSLPITSHPPSELIATPFGLHKNNGLVFLFTHYLLQQTDQSDKGEKKEFVLYLFFSSHQLIDYY